MNFCDISQLLPVDLQRELLARVLSRGGEQADIFVERRDSLSLRLEDRRLEEALSGSDEGVSLRLVRGQSAYFGYVETLSEAELMRLAEELTRIGSSGVVTSLRDTASVKGRRPALRDQVPPGAVPRDEADRSGHVERVGGRMRLVDETWSGLCPEVRQVTAVYGETTQRVWVAHSSGTVAADKRTRKMIAVTVMAQRGNLLQVGRETLSLREEQQEFDEAAVATAATLAAEKALLMLDSRPAPGGRMAVVLANGFGGVLFHEACGHGLEADYILKKASVWEGKIGQRVAGPHVFAYDDGLSAGMWGSSQIDDEGVPCQRTLLIEEGVLTGYLSDRVRAARLDLPLSGNGRRQDFRHLPYPRMTNTYFAPGPYKPEEIIADTRYALYAKSLSGGQVNPATGEFVFGVAEGYLIENGKITEPVRGATLIGNGPEVLAGIDAIADDLDVKPGMCGKEGQLVPVGSGQPTLRIRELTVGGTNV